jgi:uncharacterized SAM-binding protein YcdF (DUF218 family)
MASTGQQLEPRVTRDLQRRSHPWYLWRVCKALCGALGLLVAIVMFTPLVPWWAHKLSGGFNDPRGDVLIVLGAADGTDGILSYSSYLRAAYGVRTYREGWVKTMLLTGATAPDSFGKNSLRDFIVAHDVPPTSIRVESSARSTRENALFSKALLQNLPGTKVLMTSDYHMYRAVRVFRKTGIVVLPRPFPDAVKRGTSVLGRWPAFLDLCEENVKIAYYWARGWM